MSSCDSFHSIQEAIVRGGRILIVSHERPDGDAVSSLNGLCRLLRENGMEADAMMPDALPDFYVPFLYHLLGSIPTVNEINERYSLVINVDASTTKRVALGGGNWSELTVATVTLDHHPDDERFALYNYVDAKACSTAQVVYELAQFANWTISKETATTLLLGILTDSGCFRFDNTSPAALRAAAALLESGADHHKIIECVYLSKPLNSAVYEAQMLCHFMRTALDGQLAWFYLDPNLMKQYGIDLKNTEQLVDILRSIQGVQVAALIKYPTQPGTYKISLRSKNPAISVGRIARALEGGGHEMAAGGTIHADSVEQAELILVQYVEKEFHETQS